uniref:Uncharacterized protein n=1 Tax=Ciona savignyi TaxID=51511 RepID=H2YN74_CIOSA
YDIITSNNLFVWLTNKVSEIPITDDSSMVVFGSDTPSGLFAAYNLLIR